MLRMLKKSLRTNYQRKLARPLTLADGTKLVTLRDAANGLFDAANVRSGARQRDPAAVDGRRDGQARRHRGRDRRGRTRAARPALAVTGRRRDVEGRKDAEGHCGSLEVAMAQFREAWDAPGGNVISTRR